ncbi:MAG: hypothetical protein JWQ93_2074 [Marmoricola sp.]|nr:hypothetical protein [Marmoricola sp.]MCW2838450.1 hypothetical protein [Marmoricola sp.]
MEAVVAAFYICLSGIALLLVVGLAHDIREHRRGRAVRGSDLGAASRRARMDRRYRGTEWTVGGT